MFQTLLGDDVRKAEVGYQEMLAAEAWSTATVNNLKSYYNFEYKLTGGTYDVKIEAVDIDNTGKTLKDLTSPLVKNNKAIYGQPYSYNTDPANKIITVDGQQYEFQGSYYYTYRPTGKASDVSISNQPISSNGSLSIASMPDAERMSIKLLYKKVSRPYTYTMQSVDKNHEWLRDIINEPIETFYMKVETHRPLSNRANKGLTATPWEC